MRADDLIAVQAIDARDEQVLGWFGLRERPIIGDRFVSQAGWSGMVRGREWAFQQTPDVPSLRQANLDGSWLWTLTLRIELDAP